jgi:hypothetical protein
MSKFTEAELEAYLDETLDAERASVIERELAADSELLLRLSHINGRRDAGIHTLGEIWRRNQLGVPTREELGSYLLGDLEKEKADYIEYRVHILKCRFTIANLNDLRTEHEVNDESVQIRRSRYLKSSAGYFKDPDEPGS